MGTELALIPATAAERWKYAETLSNANLLPMAFRKRPADVFYAVEYGAMLGLSPIAALTGIHVIEGKPTASSALMSGLIRKHGHRLRVRVEGTVAEGTLKATAELVRSDDPDHTFIAVWDLYRAERAGLLTLKKGERGETVPWSRSTQGKPQAWEKFPEAMVKARAISEVCRDGAEECLFGMHYTPEELGAEVNEDGEVLAVQEVVVDGIPQQRATAPAPPAPAATVEEVVDAEVVDGPAATSEAPGPDDMTVPFNQAQEVARRAAACNDPEELLEAFGEAKARGLHDIPVDTSVSAAEGTVVAVTSPVTLKTWLIACGKYTRTSGGLSVAATVALDPAADAPADDDATSSDTPTA